jgi:hypothetical protein
LPLKNGLQSPLRLDFPSCFQRRKARNIHTKGIILHYVSWASYTWRHEVNRRPSRTSMDLFCHSIVPNFCTIEQKSLRTVKLMQIISKQFVIDVIRIWACKFSTSVLQKGSWAQETIQVGCIAITWSRNLASSISLISQQQSSSYLIIKIVSKILMLWEATQSSPSVQSFQELHDHSILAKPYSWDGHPRITEQNSNESSPNNSEIVGRRWSDTCDMVLVPDAGLALSLLLNGYFGPAESRNACLFFTSWLNMCSHTTNFLFQLFHV